MRDASENRSRLHTLPISEITRSEPEDLLLLANEVAKAAPRPYLPCRSFPQKCPATRRDLFAEHDLYESNYNELHGHDLSAKELGNKGIICGI